jgi:branched-chain amino acid transport system substrate-binding protein
MMISCRTLVLISILFVLGVGFVGCKPGDTQSKTIRIAAVAPTTGDQAEVGQDLINGIKLAVDERNAKGGVLGKNIELLVFDDSADPKEAVSVAHKITSDPTIIGVVGHMNSGTTKPATPIYSQAGIPVVMPVPTNPEITKQGFSNLFRVPPTDLDQGTDVARFAIERLGKKRFAIIHDSTAYGQPLAEVVRKTVQDAGAQVVTFDGITQGDKDFRALITRIRAANPDVLFFGGIYNEGGLIAKQARELGLDVPFLAADGTFSDKFLQIAGSAANGAVMSFTAPDEKTNDTTRTFAEKFRQSYGGIKAFAPLGYDAANVLMAGIEKAGKPEKSAIVAALHSSDFKYAGVTGESKFEDDGNNSRRSVYFFVVKNGKFEPVQSADSLSSLGSGT